MSQSEEEELVGEEPSCAGGEREPVADQKQALLYLHNCEWYLSGVVRVGRNYAMIIMGRELL